jgi:hypothetical protein
MAEDLSIPDNMNVMSRGIEEVGNVHMQHMAMACKDGSMCGGVATVLHRSFLTAGTSAGNNEKSTVS